MTPPASPPPQKELAHLHSGFGEPEPLAEFFPHESIWIVGLVEEPFQFVQLLQGEIGPASPLLDFRLPFIFHHFGILFAILQLRGNWTGSKKGIRQAQHTITHTPSQPCVDHIV